MDGKTIVSRFDALVASRKPLDAVLQQIEEYIVPYRGDFQQSTISEATMNWKRTELFDNTAAVAVDKLASQLHGNVTSSVIKWFNIRFRDMAMNMDQAAKEWLEDADEKTWQAIQQSNFGTAAPEMYLDIASFGTSVFTMEDKSDLKWEGVTFNAIPMMDAYFEMGPDDIVYNVYRLLRYTPLELGNTFDLPKSLKITKGNKSNVDIRDEVIFCIYREPENAHQDINKSLAPKLRPVQWRYVHKRTGTLLKKKGHKSTEGGYYDFPAMVIRWQKAAGSQYGYSKAMVVLSEVKQLNRLIEMTTEATAKEIDPPMKVNEYGILGDLDNVPGGLTIVADVDSLLPLLPRANFSASQMDVNRSTEQIKDGLHSSLTDLPSSGGRTATEWNIRVDNLLRQLAVTMGRLTTDLLNPTVGGVFNKLLRAGQFLPLPPSLSDIELDIEYTAPLPRALKAEVGDSMERWLMALAQQLDYNPESIDIVDFDAYNRILADQRGVPAKAIKPSAAVLATRTARAEQAKAAQEAQNIEQGGAALKSAAEAKIAADEANMDIDGMAGPSGVLA